jgi:hypothetical protein
MHPDPPAVERVADTDALVSVVVWPAHATAATGVGVAVGVGDGDGVGEGDGDALGDGDAGT